MGKYITQINVGLFVIFILLLFTFIRVVKYYDKDNIENKQDRKPYNKEEVLERLRK